VDGLTRKFFEHVLAQIDDTSVRYIPKPPTLKWWNFVCPFADPDTGQEMVIFSGEEKGDPATVDTVYVGELDADDLVVKNVKGLDFKGTLPSIAYDEVNDNWLVLVYSRVKSQRYGFYRLNRDFEVLASQDPMLVDGAEWVCSGHGIIFRPAGPSTGTNVYAFLDTIGTGVGTQMAVGDVRDTIPTWTSRPWPIFVQARPYETYNGEWGHGVAVDGVSGPLVAGDEILLIFSVHDSTDRWLLFGWGTYDAQKQFWSVGVEFDTMLGARLFGKGHEVGTPIIAYPTDLLGHHYDLIVSYGPLKAFSSKDDNVKVIRIPWWFLKRNLPGRRLLYALWFEQSISANETSPAIPGWGKKTIIFTSDTSGDLSVEIDAVGRNNWMTLFTRTGVTGVLDQTEYSALRMRLRFSAEATVSAFVAVEL